MRRRAGEIVVSVPPNVALYLLNQKRHTLSEIEKRYGFSVTIEADDELHAADCEIERVRSRRDDRERPGPELARASYEEVSDEAPADEAEGPEDREAGERVRRRAASATARTTAAVAAGVAGAGAAADATRTATAIVRRPWARKISPTIVPEHGANGAADEQNDEQRNERDEEPMGDAAAGGRRPRRGRAQRGTRR